MPRAVRKPIFASVVCALLLLPVAVLAYSAGPAADTDHGILRSLAEHDFGQVHDLGAAVVRLADPAAILVLLAGIALLGLTAGRRREVLVAAAVVAGANLTTQVLKHLLEHQRYVADFRAFNQPWADAFPSGHTTAAASIAVALLLVVGPHLRPLAAGLGIAYVAAVSFSVVLLQWHYPSDVLGGLLVVASWGFAALAALRLLRPRDPGSPARDGREAGSGGFAVSVR